MHRLATKLGSLRMVSSRASPVKATREAIDAAVARGWTVVAGKEMGQARLHKELAFKGFKQAWAFMNLVAIAATDLKHHPEWSNVYSKVSINLTTHVAEVPNSLTVLDIQLAERIDQAEQITRSGDHP
ncbi:uncharacterized protein L969DRAFT_96345 [Mixia osmundae IAM 14324]|uniref:4a-hydroxytetrahydrobiopterin dehydratase n=1 Tax=Mixia osmundae (strain CBS 9802 / IAM 14324 / JCM 22182 / KY 12970) TaxID=764103 RepID=G7DV01_MIXOS|nr:uncharacterized protein L969DRAFT_96345 [Mixia osmundae IAM 14324]KEI37256.1 hypothetical protein L969DRAFT_96345 [Mixia osmundae IAM 14324]GAA94411.1 hypothetical protein E5Q_01063 [Mixia osmundae IAM 14324]